jgi:hypothetical protein
MNRKKLTNTNTSQKDRQQQETGETDTDYLNKKQIKMSSTYRNNDQS